MFKAWDWRWLEQGTRTENFHLQGRIFLGHLDINITKNTLYYP